MISLPRVLLACAGGLLLAPLAAAAQPQAETPAPAAETTAPQPEGESAEDKQAEDQKRVCRSVRADPSSRRKTRVCRTVEEWRKLNVPL
jgi:hypothetical protein